MSVVYVCSRPTKTTIKSELIFGLVEGHFDHTSWFFGNSGKTAVHSAAFFATYSYINFSPFKKI